jgi:hypothetical protein
VRADVLEVMAEEVAGRPVDALASFVTWDEGRRKLDGMSRGKRWDIDREHRAFEKDTDREVRRLMKLRARHKSPEVYRAWHRRYEAEHKARRAQLRKQRYRKNRDKLVAKGRAQYAKHREKRRAESLAYYYAHLEERRAANREWDRKNRPREGKRRCSQCGQPGHNKLTCPRAEAAA